jgi:hypothetical protein
MDLNHATLAQMQQIQAQLAAQSRYPTGPASVHMTAAQAAQMAMNEAAAQKHQAAAAAAEKKRKAEEAENNEKNELSAEIDEEVFLAYKCQSLSIGEPHPGRVSEPGLLASMSLPKAVYPHDALLDAVEKKKLSQLQLEGVLFAAQRHQHMLPNGERAGFFIGDGAGVGKGRQVAGIILNSLVRKCPKHLWFSISSDLIVDAKRDLDDLSAIVDVHDGCKSLDAASKKGLGGGKSHSRGVLFSTYNTLISAVSQKGAGKDKLSRLDQLVGWCGGEKFEGCLVFDECHKAKNFDTKNEEKSTKMAAAVIKIQQRLPNARVVYCSATGVSDVKNMAYANRLGLWGHMMPFPNFAAFTDNMEKRGLGALEMLAMEMKAGGMYVSRGLSYEGAEFVSENLEMDIKQRADYDTAVDFWLDLKEAVDRAVGLTHLDGAKDTQIYKQYWSAHQRFFKQMCVAAKISFIVKDSKRAIDAGHCVVIGLQTTGEAAMDKARKAYEKAGLSTLKSFISVTREMLRQFVVENFPTKTVLPPPEKEEAVMATVGMYSSNGMPAQAQQYLQAWKASVAKYEKFCGGPVEACRLVAEELLKRIDALSLPDSPVDELIDQLGGPAMVSEMTGRKGRMVRVGERPAEGKEDNLRVRYQERGADMAAHEVLNIIERKAFQDGEKLVAIISDAASTGISLHAGRREKNQRRREHYTIELPWSADKAIQQLGRSHRSDQASAPIYHLVNTQLGGERRFAASVARRLQSLGALTKGDRRAATGNDMSKYDFDNKLGKLALEQMYNAILVREIPPGTSVEKLVQLAHPTVQAQAKRAGSEEEKVALVVECLVQAEEAMQNDKPEHRRDVKRFLNRILGMRINQQNMIFDAFMGSLSTRIRAEKEAGTFDEGMNTIKGESIKLVEDVDEDALREFYEEQGTKDPAAKAKRQMARVQAMDETHGRLQANLLAKYGKIPNKHSRATMQQMQGQQLSAKTEAKAIWVDPITNASTYRYDLVIDRGVSFGDAVVRHHRALAKVMAGRAVVRTKGKRRRSLGRTEDADDDMNDFIVNDDEEEMDAEDDEDEDEDENEDEHVEGAEEEEEEEEAERGRVRGERMVENGVGGKRKRTAEQSPTQYDYTVTLSASQAASARAKAMEIHSQTSALSDDSGGRSTSLLELSKFIGMDLVLDMPEAEAAGVAAAGVGAAASEEGVAIGSGEANEAICLVCNIRPRKSKKVKGGGSEGTAAVGRSSTADEGGDSAGVDADGKVDAAGDGAGAASGAVAGHGEDPDGDPGLDDAAAGSGGGGADGGGADDGADGAADGGAAFEQVRIGDELLEVNGQSIRSSTTQSLLQAMGLLDEEGGGSGGDGASVQIRFTLKAPFAKHQLRSTTAGFYISKAITFGTFKAFLAVPKADWQGVIDEGDSSQEHSLIKPNLGKNGLKLLFEIRKSYRKVSMREMRSMWCKQYQDSALPAYKWGVRKQFVTLLAGSISPIWETLQSLMVQNTMGLSKVERSLKAARAELGDGSRIVGIRFPGEKLGQELRKALDALKEKRLMANGGNVACGAQAVVPVDAVEMAKIMGGTYREKTMKNFFSAAPSSGGAALPKQKKNPFDSVGGGKSARMLAPSMPPKAKSKPTQKQAKKKTAPKGLGTGGSKMQAKLSFFKPAPK